MRSMYHLLSSPHPSSLRPSLSPSPSVPPPLWHTDTTETDIRGCKACPNGTYTAKVGETSATSCIFCAPGYEHLDAYVEDHTRYRPAILEHRCSPCPINTFLSYPGTNHSITTTSDSQCAPPILCPPHEPASELSPGMIHPGMPAAAVPSTRRCTACPTAKYALGGATECLPCGSGGLSVSDRIGDKGLFDQFDCQCDSSCAVACADNVCYRRQTRSFFQANATCMLWGGQIIDYTVHPDHLMQALELLNATPGFYFATASVELDDIHRAWCAAVQWNETIVLKNGTRISLATSLMNVPKGHGSGSSALESENHFHALCDSSLPSLCFKCRPNHVTLPNATCVPCNESMCAPGFYYSQCTDSFDGCLPCAPGSYSIGSVTSCTLCANGKYAVNASGEQHIKMHLRPNTHLHTQPCIATAIHNTC